jgi:hypothetical protein
MICDYVKSENRGYTLSNGCVRLAEHFYLIKLGRLSDGNPWLKPIKRCSLHRLAHEVVEAKISEDEYKTYELIHI